MAATKTPRQLLASQTLAAGASVNVAEWNLSTAYGGKLCIRITNGSSPPASAPVVTFFSGDATGKKYKQYSAAGDVVASSQNDIYFTYGLEDMFANATIQNGGGNSITVEAYGQEATTI
jgi:hypothetical protein